MALRNLDLLIKTGWSVRAVLNVPSFSFQIAEFLDPKIRNSSGHCKRDGLPKFSRRAELQVRTQQLCPMNDCKLAPGSWSQGHYVEHHSRAELQVTVCS